jgi:ABC-type branched-subunit amino acid transport system substrate-binding protein/DNA-binding beta-propeller fold protein YncE
MTARLAPGSGFAGYRIESFVGRGGMGVVYRATDLSLGRPVALKLIAPELADDARFRERFLNEPRLAASLDHSSVIPIYEAGQHDGQLYLAMRYVPGSDLRTLLERDGALAPERALAILGQIAGALDAAHRQGLVHRDVKPANVLLDEDEHAYLTDFGITKQLSEDSGDAGQGTLDYLAPEQIRGEPVDGRTDGYALACVLYECLAGRPAYRRQSEAETLWAHLREDPPELESHPALDPVLSRGLAQEPDDRYPTCTELIEAASDVLQPRASRHRAIIVAGLALIAVAFAAAVLAASPGEERGAALRAPKGNGIAAVSPSSARIQAFVKIAAAPSNIAVGEGAVWFLDSESATVARLDPGTGAITGRVTAPDVPTDVAAGAGAVWLGTGGGAGANWTNTVSRIDPQTDKVTASVQLPDEATGGDRVYINNGFPQIAVGGGAVWATGGGAVARLDAGSGVLKAMVQVDAGRIAAGREGVWFVSPHDSGAVTQIDTRTNRPRRPFRVGDVSLSGIAVGAGSVWVTASREGVVWRITPNGSSVARPIQAGTGADYIAYGAGAVWVGNSVDGTLSQIDPATNRVVARTPIGALKSLAAGAGSAWASTAGAIRAGRLPVSACGPALGGRDPDLLVVSDLPLLPGPAGADARAMADAIGTVFADHGYRAGTYTVGYRSCDDSTRQAGAPELAHCVANANAYANVERLVAVIGPQTSGCAQVELPILNRAPGGPPAVISPTNSDPGLTREGVPPPDGYRGSPDVFYPIGIRHYVRVSAPDVLFGPAHARLSQSLGLRRVFVVTQRRSSYWKTVLADSFRHVARRFGIRVVGSASVDLDARSYAALVDRVERSRAEGVVLAAHPFGNVAQLVKALRARLGQPLPIMVGDSFGSISTQELFAGAGPALRDVYVATADVQHTVGRMTAAAHDVAREVDADRPGVLEAAQATELVLDAIAASDGTRASVLDGLRVSSVSGGILGTFRFDANGDMTPGWVAILRFTKPDRGDAKDLRGAVVDRVVHVPTSDLD